MARGLWQAVQAGARFITTLGLNLEVVDWCVAKGVPVIPGVASPSEVEAASRRGLRTLKFFPAEANGGCAGLRAVAAPYPHLNFYPTGGSPRRTCKTISQCPKWWRWVAVGWCLTSSWPPAMWSCSAAWRTAPCRWHGVRWAWP